MSAASVSVPPQVCCVIPLSGFPMKIGVYGEQTWKYQLIVLTVASCKSLVKRYCEEEKRQRR